MRVGTHLPGITPPFFPCSQYRPCLQPSHLFLKNFTPQNYKETSLTTVLYCIGCSPLFCVFTFCLVLNTGKTYHTVKVWGDYIYSTNLSIHVGDICWFHGLLDNVCGLRPLISIYPTQYPIVMYKVPRRVCSNPDRCYPTGHFKTSSSIDIIQHCMLHPKP